MGRAKHNLCASACCSTGKRGGVWEKYIYICLNHSRSRSSSSLNRCMYCICSHTYHYLVCSDWLYTSAEPWRNERKQPNYNVNTSGVLRQEACGLRARRHRDNDRVQRKCVKRIQGIPAYIFGTYLALCARFNFHHFYSLDTHGIRAGKNPNWRRPVFVLPFPSQNLGSNSERQESVRIVLNNRTLRLQKP